MKQPRVELKTLVDDGYHWVDVDGDEGGMIRTAIACGASEKSAWKAAKRRLEKLLQQVDEKLTP